TCCRARPVLRTSDPTALPQVADRAAAARPRRARRPAWLTREVLRRSTHAAAPENGWPCLFVSLLPAINPVTASYRMKPAFPGSPQISSSKLRQLGSVRKLALAVRPSRQGRPRSYRRPRRTPP